MKEMKNMFNLDSYLKELDLLYSSGRIGEVEGYLKKGLKDAASSGDDGAVFGILNELMGYYRGSSRYEECIICMKEAIKMADSMGIVGSLSYGTLLLNGATGYRAAGSYQEAERLYKEAYEVLLRWIPKTDYRMAALHNNLSLLYGETGRLEKAKDELVRAMHIIKEIDGAGAEVAITHTNLGNICFQLKQIQEGTEHMKEAVRRFEAEPDQKDSHYASALAGLGEAYFHSGNLEESIKYYEKALKEIEGTYGENDYYRVTLGNLETVKDLQKRRCSVRIQRISGLDIAREYFTAYGKPMLQNKYREYAERIAAGLVGEGSECLGFDDAYSSDHDYGPGFCLWLEKRDYEAIGAQLSEDYKSLPGEFMGFPARNATDYGQNRVGVFEIGDFYQRLAGCRNAPALESQWLNIPQEALCAATNGEVFVDRLGEFTKRREAFLSCPERVRLKWLAEALGRTAQAGQYNYSRSRLRGDKGAMYFSLSEFIKGAVEIAYLLNNIYMPFYKWRMRKMEAFTCLLELKPALTELMELEPGDASMEERMEAICRMLVKELNRQGISSSRDSFLESQQQEICKFIREMNRGSGDN